MAFRNAFKATANGSPLLTLAVPDGAWAIFAKMNVDNDDTASTHTLDCILKANGKVIDENLIRVAPSGVQRLDNFEVTLMAAVNFPGGGPAANNVTLECSKEASGLVTVRLLKIMAIRVDSVSVIQGA